MSWRTTVLLPSGTCCSGFIHSRYTSASQKVHLPFNVLEEMFPFFISFFSVKKSRSTSVEDGKKREREKIRKAAKQTDKRSPFPFSSPFFFKRPPQVILDCNESLLEAKSILFWALVLLETESNFFWALATSSTQPATVVRKTEAQLEYTHTRTLHTRFWLCMFSRCLLAKTFCIGAQSEA